MKNIFKRLYPLSWLALGSSWWVSLSSLEWKKSGSKYLSDVIAKTRKNFHALGVCASDESGSVEPFALLKEAD